MKKNTKGFTLIELLAVIVILAIIALIAVPVVLNLIEKARVGAAQDSAYGLRKSAQLYYATSLLDPTGFAGAEFTCDGTSCKTADGKNLDLDGTVPSEGKVVISKTGDISYYGIAYDNNAFSCHGNDAHNEDMKDTGKIYCKKS